MTAAAASGRPPLLRVEGLCTGFPSRAGMLHAVDGVDFSLDRGEILGLVGESGSGKSVTGFSILGLVDPPGRILGGRVLLDGVDLAALDEPARRAIRGKRIAMIFQDPMMTLNPVLRIDTQMIEAVTAHEATGTAQARERARAALVQVGIAAPDERLLAYPHQLSGGMRQRVAIAIALVNRPDLIIADEPTTALDVTIQGQILHEMQALVRESGTALVWITHDLSVVAGLADRVCVMYAGRIVESGPVDAVLDAPRHPYTRGLIDSVPAMNPRGRPLAQIPGNAPSPVDLPPGCTFRARCSRAIERCGDMPPLEAPADEGGGGGDGTRARTVRCWNPVPLPAQGSR
ncbi:MAG: ABC transporter ATP-binding protein [bacterium]